MTKEKVVAKSPPLKSQIPDLIREEQGDDEPGEKQYSIIL
ncbi:hypothetical protein ABID22_002864 [Pontibacter aydingkolensis]